MFMSVDLPLWIAPPVPQNIPVYKKSTGVICLVSLENEDALVSSLVILA